MYFQTFTQADFDAQKATRRQQEAEALALEARTVDKVNCGEQQPEVDHAYKGEKSDSGYDDDGRFWRNTRSYISYQLQNKGLAGKTLDIHFSGNLKTEDVGIFINDRAAEIIAVKDKVIVLKTDDKEMVSLKIVSENGRPTPRFFQIRLIKE
jgi:hypothetical protein